MDTTTTRYQKYLSPVGTIVIVANHQFLKKIVFAGNWGSVLQKAGPLPRGDNTIISRTRTQLQEYFRAERTHFNLPLSFRGTEFQQLAWETLLTIPYGKTHSYQEQAKLMGRVKAVRAVGSANGANPLPIVIPCHRVIGKSGKISGFTGGPEIKKFLLLLEGHIISHMKVTLASS